MSTLNVDALVGNTSANAITVRGEGTATTSLQQGLAKAWGHLNYSTGSFADSFNNSSATDFQAGSSNDVDGTWGSYTIQEGAEDLFLINKRSGKKFKFNLTEVS